MWNLQLASLSIAITGCAFISLTPNSGVNAVAVHGVVHEGWGNIVYSKIDRPKNSISTLTPTTSSYSTITEASTTTPASTYSRRPPAIIFVSKQQLSSASSSTNTAIKPTSTPHFEAPTNALLDDPINDPINALQLALQGSKKSYKHSSTIQYGNYRAKVSYSTPFSRYNDGKPPKPAPPPSSPPPPPKSKVGSNTVTHEEDQEAVEPNGTNHEGIDTEEKRGSLHGSWVKKAIVWSYEDEKEEENLELAWRLARMAVEDIVARIKAGDSGFEKESEKGTEDSGKPSNDLLSSTNTNEDTDLDKSPRRHSRDTMPIPQRKKWEKTISMVILATGREDETAAVGEAWVEEHPEIGMGNGAG